MQFNNKKYDFWEIYESLKRFYPIGIQKNESELYSSYPGLKELEGIIVDNIHNTGHFTSRWANFTKEIEVEIGKEVVGTTYGQAPAFSSYVLLETSSADNLTRDKELHFFVSLVGPFYTVVGQDLNAVKVGERTFRSTNYLVVSPVYEFADSFNLICHKIENRFNGFRFVPFWINSQTIEGLSVRYSDENLNTIFNSLFNNQIDLTTNGKIGTIYFKSDDWIKEGYVDAGESWTSYPPSA